MDFSRFFRPRPLLALPPLFHSHPLQQRPPQERPPFLAAGKPNRQVQYRRLQRQGKKSHNNFDFAEAGNLEPPSAGDLSVEILRQDGIRKTGLTVYGKIAYFVIPSEARNLSLVETQEKRDSSLRSE